MHFSILLASTLLAAYTAAAPTSTISGQVALQIGVALDGDDAEDRTIDFGQLVNGNAAGLPPATTIEVSISEGVLLRGKPLSDDAIVCQAFSDAAGKVQLGSPFSTSNIKLSATQLVTIGSIFCSDAAGVAAFTSSTSTAEATIQIEFDGDEGAAQGTVPVNSVLTPTKGHFASPSADSASIVSVSSADAAQVKCEAFSDASGTKLLGILLGNGGSVIFDSTGKDVPIAFFKCSLA
jgi:hypothetical protein